MKERVLFEIFRGTTCEKAETCYVLPDSIVFTQQIYIYIYFFLGGRGGGGGEGVEGGHKNGEFLGAS